MEPVVVTWLLINILLAVVLAVVGYWIGRSVKRRQAERDRAEMLAALRRPDRAPMDETGGVRTSATPRTGGGVRRMHTPGRR